MKIILNTHFQIESIADDKASRIVKGSNLFDELGVYIPQALYNSYTSIYPSYSVKRADNRQLGEYAMATADNTSFTGYYGWKTHLHQRDLAVAGPLEITISFALNGTVKKTICKVTANVDSAIELSNDVFIVTRGENDEILAIESLVDAVEDLQQECTQVSNTLLTKADLNNADQEITAKSVEAETFEQDGNNVLDSSDVVDDVTTEDATKVLSAKQGKALKTLIDALTTSLSTEYYKKAQTYSSTEIDGLIANFVTKSVNDLTNYYLKSETYNKTEIDNMLSTLSSFEVVQALPTENIKTSVIYLLQNGQFYDEYIYSNNDWVMIGTTNIDFSDYYTKAQINAMLNVINEAINGVDIVNEEVEFEADIPSSAKGLATLGKVGGMSYKCFNLFDLISYVNSGLDYARCSVTTSNDNLVLSATDTDAYVGAVATSTGYSYTSNYGIKIKVKPNTTYFINLSNTVFNKNYVTFFDKNNLSIGFSSISTNSTYFTTLANTSYICFRLGISNSVSGTDYSTTIMFNEGSTALPYQPYFEGIRDTRVTSVVSKNSNNEIVSTLSIPRELLGSYYGIGLNDNLYNYIDFTTKEYVQKVGIVDLGSLNWSYDGTYFLLPNNPINDAKKPTSNTQAFIGLCDKYDIIAIQPLSSNTDKRIAMTQQRFLYVRDSSYTDATAFKEAMSGVYLYYELATPVETDISSYLGDKHIPIEANGSLTFTNTYNQAVPSTITFDCGLIEVVKTNHEHDLEQQKDIDSLKANQKQLQTDVSGLDTRLDNVEEDVGGLKTDVTNLKGIHLYQHTIFAENTQQTNMECHVCFTILNSSATPITDFATVWWYLQNNNSRIKLQASGTVYSQATEKQEPIAYIISDSDSMDDSIYIYGNVGEILQAYTTFTDTVKQLF